MITLINHQGLKVIKGLQLQSPSPSIGLAYMGGYLKSKMFPYHAIDACGEALDQVYPYLDYPDVLVQGLTPQEVYERIPANTKIFGFTCLFSQCWPIVFKMAQEIKKFYPSALMVAGGEHPTALPHPILSSKVFDCIVYGEGEETFYELVQAFQTGQNWKGIDGIYYLNSDHQLVKNKPRKRIHDIDQLPWPDWDSWPIKSYIEHQQVTGINLGRSIPILGSRGCPYACTFCSNEEMWTRRFIMRNPKLLVDEMEFLKNKYNLDGFTFMDSTFIINQRKIKDFCKELIKRNLNVVYQLPAGTRCEAIDEELVSLLEQSGLRNLALAPESGSEEILKATKKQINLKSLIRSVQIITKTKISLAIFIVIGFPEDTKDSLRKTLSLIRKLAWLGAHDVTVSKFTPYPGSSYFLQLQKEGRDMPDYQSNYKLINFFSKQSDSYCESFNSRTLHFYMLWFFINFYTLSFIRYPFRMVQNLLIYFSKGIETTRYIRMFSEIFSLRKQWKEKNRLNSSF